MIVYIVVLVLMGIFFLLLRNQEKENVHVMEKVLRSLKEKKVYDKIPPELKEQYIETLHKIIRAGFRAR